MPPMCGEMCQTIVHRDRTTKALHERRSGTRHAALEHYRPCRRTAADSQRRPKFVVVFNGEIYNFPELRHELEGAAILLYPFRYGSHSSPIRGNGLGLRAKTARNVAIALWTSAGSFYCWPATEWARSLCIMLCTRPIVIDRNQSDPGGASGISRDQSGRPAAIFYFGYIPDRTRRFSASINCLPGT